MPELEQMCPRYEQAAMLLGKKWMGLILRILMKNPKRFGEFKAQVPQLSDRILSERLKELVETGVVERVVHPTTPVSIEYRLTEKGKALLPVVRAVQRWADDWVKVPAGEA